MKKGSNAGNTVKSHRLIPDFAAASEFFGNMIIEITRNKTNTIDKAFVLSPFNIVPPLKFP
jgi:hypothetical protein